MKSFILSFLLLLSPLAMSAQETNYSKYRFTPVKHFEAEVGIGFTSPLTHYSGAKAQIGPAFLYEFRYNLDELPMDFSVQLNHTTASYSTPFSDEESNTSFSCSIFGDWNFRQGERVNPFVGLGLGWASHEMDYNGDDLLDDRSKPVLIPRVGVELLHHLRLTLSSNISGKGYNNLQFTIGVAFGGGVKK